MSPRTSWWVNSVLIAIPVSFMAATFGFLMSAQTHPECLDEPFVVWVPFEFVICLARASRRFLFAFDAHCPPHPKAGLILSLFSAFTTLFGVYANWYSVDVCARMEHINVFFWVCLLVVMSEVASALMIFTVFAPFFRGFFAITCCDPCGGVEDSQGDKDCVICLDRVRNRFLPSITCTLACKHRFHSRCLDEWVERSETCPICRQVIDF